MKDKKNPLIIKDVIGFLEITAILFVAGDIAYMIYMRSWTVFGCLMALSNLGLLYLLKKRHRFIFPYLFLVVVVEAYRYFLLDEPYITLFFIPLGTISVLVCFIFKEYIESSLHKGYVKHRHKA